mmetsp:Transcript_5664/g.19207  ORF Transcript_5664/g.19207 Transcript_5664/m.19207 type:complete len:248 (+) Transcript_5664:710-1453(+)
MPSQIFSSAGIQLAARWQFCSSTHPPLAVASSIMRAALGPCPCPIEMMITLLAPNPTSSANLSSAAVGSLPGESTKSSGLVTLDSAKLPGRSKGGGSMKRCPMTSATKSCTPGTTLSGRRHRSTSSFWKLLRSPAHLPGSATLCGSGLSYTTFQSSMRSVKLEGKSSNTPPSSLPSLPTSAHPLSVSHAGAGLTASPLPRPTPPVSRKLYSLASIVPRLLMMRQQSRNAKSSLSFSKSERHTLRYRL